MRLLASMLALLTCLCGLLPLSGCVQKRPREDDNGKLRVACVGDSITFGFDLPRREETCYPAVLNGLLGERFVVENFGAPGAGVLRQGELPYLRLEEYARATAFRPNVVLVLLGTNDGKARNRRLLEDDFVTDYRVLLDSFRQLPSAPVVFACLPPPVFGVNESGIDPALVNMEVVARVRQAAKAACVPVIDLHTPLIGHAAWFPDGVHPSREGAALLATSIHAAIKDTTDAPAMRR